MKHERRPGEGGVVISGLGKFQAGPENRKP